MRSDSARGRRGGLFAFPWVPPAPRRRVGACAAILLSPSSAATRTACRFLLFWYSLAGRGASPSAELAASAPSPLAYSLVHGAGGCSVVVHSWARWHCPAPSAAPSAVYFCSIFRTVGASRLAALSWQAKALLFSLTHQWRGRPFLSWGIAVSMHTVLITDPAWPTGACKKETGMECAVCSVICVKAPQRGAACTAVSYSTLKEAMQDTYTCINMQRTVPTAALYTPASLALSGCRRPLTTAQLHCTSQYNFTSVQLFLLVGMASCRESAASAAQYFSASESNSAVELPQCSFSSSSPDG